MANEQRRPTDDELVQAIRSGVMPEHSSIADLCDELLKARRAQRADSREAHQLRRLRWTVENMLMKTEGVLEHVVRLGADRSDPPPPQMEDDDDRE